MTLWGGRFEKGLDPRIDRLNRSLGFDRRLYREDVEGSIAWAKALQRAGIYTKKELAAVVKGLKTVRKEFEEGTFVVGESDEDIHTAVERRLTELAGDAGAKLHTGRSRNDQVACDLHLWLRRACDEAHASILAVMGALLDLAERAEDIAIPAYTHLQRAQPVLAAHHLLAYERMLQRDLVRFDWAHSRAGGLNLGCGAATGTGFPIDRNALAADLGFDWVVWNSLDAVGSRDAALDFLSAAVLLALHLSRLGEEIVLWTSSEFGFLRLSDAVSTGSSLLPQKRNPDGAELARGKAGRVLGDFVALATTLKGLPLAYNKDLQEDKEALFDAADTLHDVCDAMAATLSGVSFDPERCAAALKGGHVLATELADYLVMKGVPFRRAHGIVGALVLEAEKRGLDVSELPYDVLHEAAPEFEPDVAGRLTIQAALAARSAIGGTAPKNVKQALASFRSWYATTSKRHAK